jgi:serine/threonine-protein kinase
MAYDGTLEFWIAGSGRDVYELVWVDENGVPTPVEPGWTVRSRPMDRSWDLSPDGRRLAWAESGDGELGDIWIRELPRGPRGPLILSATGERFPRWTPDGEEVTFQATKQQETAGWIRRADMTGEGRALVPFDGYFVEAQWTPDQRGIVFRTGIFKGDRDILWYRPGSDSLPQELLAEEYDETMPALSPDGQWIAYVSDRSGQREVYANPFPDTHLPSVQISQEGGRQPAWGRDGRHLYFLSEGGTRTASREMWMATVDPGPPFRVIDRERLFTLPEGFYFSEVIRTYNVDENGTGSIRFLMGRVADTGESSTRKHYLVRNFTARLTDIEWR